MSAFLLLTWLTLWSVPRMAAAYSGKLLLVSMDGFRWDYLDKVDTPNFDKFAKQGVKLPYMETSIVTKTFPTHFTMITGLYAETHGITDNRMYDPVFNESFNISTRESKWWNGGEPLWVTAKNQGLRTGTFYWPGSEVEIRGVRPDYWFSYSNDPPYKERVDTVVDWFKNRNVEFATLYFPEPDGTGHRFGPDSPEVRAKVAEMDAILGYLMQKMKDSSLDDQVNVIVASDHGMTLVDNVRKVVDITDYLDMAKIKRVPSIGPLAQIQPLEGEENAIIRNLTGVPHITVYKKDDIPDRFHYRKHRRIMPIVVMADEGWLITTDKKRQATSPTLGRHGYDNRLQSMKPIFLARGPNFKINFKSHPIRNVDIYPLVCRLLNIMPSANNGSLEMVSGMIRASSTVTKASHPFSSNSEISRLIQLIMRKC